MENWLSKSNDKPFTLHTPPVTLGYLQKAMSGVQKNPVKYFVTSVHQRHGYERLTQSIESSVIDMYNRFPSQSY